VSALLFIIIIYYIIVSLRQKSCRENYGPVETVFQPFQKVPWNSGTNDFVFANGSTNTSGCGTCSTTPKRTVIQLTPNNSNPGLINTSDSLRWCPNEVPIEQTLSQNQRLVGPQNPKTLVQPVLSSRSHDFQVWTPNDFVVPTFLNEDRRQELYQNGYVPTSFQQFNVPVEQQNANIMESYDYMPYNYPTIDRACGYDPNNLNYNLPINYNADRCEKTPEMTEYNRNLYTIPIQPGLNTFSQVNQPYASMSNLGISMATPFLPTEFEPNGNTSYGQGNFIEESGPWPKEQQLQTPNYPLRSDIYDPRYTGYSANYRNYIDPMTGQPRFYYDDIDSQVQSNYITRNNIDFTQYAPQIGPASPSHYTNMEIRDMANNTYMDSVIQQRTELQQRLMHKNSNREWQLRKAPISRQNQARASGGKSNSGGGYAGPRG
jgi:hypothetical protein